MKTCGYTKNQVGKNEGGADLMELNVPKCSGPSEDVSPGHGRPSVKHMGINDDAM